MIRIRPVSTALALALVAGSSGVQAEDLLQVYKEARAADPILAGAEATKLATDEYVDQARAQLLPQINANFSYQQRHGGDDTPNYVTDPVTGEPVLVNGYSNNSHSRSLSGTLNQSLIDVSRWTALSSSRATADAGAATLEAAQQALFVRVATAYFDVLTAEDALEFAQGNETALGRQLEQAQQRFDVGLAAITDVNDAKAQHDSAVARVIVAQNVVDDAREALRQITDKQPGELAHLRDELPLDKPNPPDPQEWVDLALRENPTLSAATFDVAAANADIRTARAGHLPTLDATVGYSRNPSWGDTRLGGVDRHNSSDPWSTTVGVTLSVPIFSGGFTQSRVRQTIHQRDFAADQLEAQRRQVVADTRSNYRAVLSGASEVEATQAAVVSARSSLEATQAGYEVGTRTIVDVLISQQTLLEAQSNYSRARHAFVLNGLLLKQSAGVIELEDLQLVNALLE